MKKLIYVLSLLLLIQLGVRVVQAGTLQSTPEPEPVIRVPDNPVVQLSEVERLRGQNFVLTLQNLQTQANTLLGQLNSLTLQALAARKLDPTKFEIDWESCFAGSPTPDRCGSIQEKTDDGTEPAP